MLKMLRLTNPGNCCAGRGEDGCQNPGEDRWNRRWCAVVILVAVCALTVSVATRYSVSRADSNSMVRTTHKHVSPDHGRQRLIKSAATWMPVVVCCAVLQAPTSYPRVAPAEPPARSLLIEENLYNRPPPASSLL